MSSYGQIFYQLVFCTKYREATIARIYKTE